MLFRGLNAVSLDAKGRLAIPVRHRDTINTHCQGKLVVTIGNGNRCLAIYPIHEFEEMQRQIEALPTLDKQAQRLKRMFIGHANDVEMDGNGRILLPQELRKYVGLDKKVALVGQGRKFEVWDEDAWNEQREDWLEQTDEEVEYSEQLLKLSF